MKIASKTWLPLAIALFLAPIIGGQLFVDAMKIDPGVSAISLAMKGAPETPWLSHAYLSLFIVAAALWLAFSQKVIAIPKVPLSALVVLFGGCLIVSFGASQFKLVSAATVAEWLIYLAAFFVAAAVAGRAKGSHLLVAAVIAGCTVASLMGILEYGQMRRIDPTWRIFASWVNSNALAGMLVIGLVLALGAAVSGKRLVGLIAGISASLIGLALMLTQSRGAIIYALPVGIATLIVGNLFLKGTVSERLIRACKAIAPLIVTGLLMLSFTRLGAEPGQVQDTPNALARVSTQADHAREQSSSFRLMLWKSSLMLMKQNPGGYGMGTFRYEGSRTGLIVPTHLGHQSFLQLGVEASPAAPVLLIAIGCSWLFYMLRGVRNSPYELSAMRIAIVAAIVASAAHSMFDSDLYQFGIGVTFFALLGIGLSSAADGVSPEYLPAPIRISFPIGAVAAAAGLWFAGQQKLTLSEALGAVSAGDLATAQSAIDRAVDAGVDGEAFYLKSRSLQDGNERLQMLKKAVNLSPSPKYYRALAREQLAAGNTLDAVDSYNRALKRDPNGLQTLGQLLDLYIESGNAAKAKEVAERMVAVEQSPSFTIRAIPEAVPAETFYARFYLAYTERKKDKAIEILKPAVAGFIQYHDKTLAKLLFMAKDDPQPAFAGETVETATKTMDRAALAAQMLKKLYLETGDRSGAEDAGRALDSFKEGLDSLRKISK